MNIFIIQPAIPKYRIPFFKKLMLLYSVRFYASKEDFLGVKTVFKPTELFLSSGFITFFNKLYWHKKLPLFSPYKKGDVVVINGNPRILNYMLLFALLRLRGIKTVWWGHGWSAGSFGLMAKIRIKLMSLASAILVYTDKEKEQLSKSNCYALNNGLDSSEIRGCIKKLGIKRHVNQTNFNLVFIGRITAKANFEMLLQSISFVNSNVHLNVIGSGDKADYFKAMADELDISDRVHWHGAVFDEMSIAKIMLSSHAFIYTGSVGLSLIHGFNYGLPAIVHSNESFHMPEFAAFDDGINGFSFRQNDSVDLSDKINELSTLGECRVIAMSTAAFKTVEHSYNTDDMALRFSNMINNLK